MFGDFIEEDNIINKNELSDMHLIKSIRDENNYDYLIILFKRYKNFISSICKPYFIPGAEYEDLYQEGLVGLFKAIRDYKFDKNIKFEIFASICIRRQIITAVKTATRQKHRPLNAYVSLEKPLYEFDGDRAVIDIIPSSNSICPEKSYILKEMIEDVNFNINSNLTKLEYSVLILYLEGNSYLEIANKLSRGFRSVTNTMYSLQKKLKKIKKIVALDFFRETGEIFLS